MTDTYIVKTRAWNEDGTPEAWVWIAYDSQRERDKAARIYREVGGLDVETVDIYRESEVVQ